MVYARLQLIHLRLSGRATHNFMIIYSVQGLIIMKLLAVLALNNNSLNQIKYIYWEGELPSASYSKIRQADLSSYSAEI